MYAVIMAGGAGTRLWPMSRAAKPKQFHALVGDQPLLVEAVERLHPTVPVKQIYIGTTKELSQATKALLPKIPESNYFIEPVARNTGPAVGLASAILGSSDPKAVVAVLWSDHHIGRPEEFRAVLATAEKAIKKHPTSLVTIGINPTEPSTALGYIQMNSTSEEIDGRRIFKAKKFIEKPDYQTAKRYVASWKYLWNAGYFIFRVDTMLKLFARHAPKIYAGLMKVQRALGTDKEEKVLVSEFAKFPNVPVDTLIAEKTESMYVIPADLDWSDIGSWSSLHDILIGKFGGHVIAKGHHVGHDDENALIFAHDKLIATVGLKDVVVVDTHDVLLIANKNRSQDVKQLLEKLKEQGKHLYL